MQLASGLKRFLSRNRPPGLSSRPASTLWQPAHKATMGSCRFAKANENPAPVGLFLSSNRLSNVQQNPRAFLSRSPTRLEYHLNLPSAASDA